MLITLTEGKKRQIRYMIEALGLKTIALKRVKISGLLLGNLVLGKSRHLTEKEIKNIMQIKY